jgi:F-type H+-transporting ATPase subunit epsilon
MVAIQPLKARLITPEKILFEGEVRSVIAPAVDGMLGVLGGHAPLMAALGSGVLKLALAGEPNYFAVTGGFLQVKDNNVIVLADKAVAAASVDLAEARDRQARLENRLGSESEPAEKRRLEAELREAKTVVQAVEKHLER